MKIRFYLTILSVVIVSAINGNNSYAGSACETSVATFETNLKTFRDGATFLQDKSKQFFSTVMAKTNITQFKDPTVLNDLDSKIKELVKLRTTLVKAPDDFYKNCPCQRMDKYKTSYGRTFDARNDNDCRTYCDSKNGKPVAIDTCLFGKDVLYTYPAVAPSPSPSVKK